MNATQLALEIKHDFGTVVYHVCGEQVPGVVVGYMLNPGAVLYIVSWGKNDEDCRHYDFELSLEKRTEVPV